jgi:hypothetical protein
MIVEVYLRNNKLDRTYFFQGKDWQKNLIDFFNKNDVTDIYTVHTGKGELNVKFKNISEFVFKKACRDENHKYIASFNKIIENQVIKLWRDNKLRKI